MKATYIDHMGSDLSVVNAARVSFGKQHDVFQEKDTGLIQYLAKHKHETPFAHTSITLHIKAPIFVRTQCFKHKVGFVENEISRRYVSETPEFFTPKQWRKKADDKKQGSSSLIITNLAIEEEIEDIYKDILWIYDRMIADGYAPEQARMVLPQSMFTEWYWTGSLLAFARFYNLRTGKDAQLETQTLAKEVGEIIAPLYPVAWKSITEKTYNN
jgi:thymidylate synthase (FAD)